MQKHINLKKTKMGNVQSKEPEIEKRIKESEYLGGISLNLNDLELTTQDLEKLIPVIKERLPKLKRLFLANNKLKSLPDDIIKVLTNITNVDLSKNPLSTETLLKIIFLKKLEIFNLGQQQNITTDDETNWENFVDFAFLLEAQKSKKIKDEVEQKIKKSEYLGGLSLDLNGLDLRTQDLEKLIPVIKERLPKLKQLFLANNKLKSLPDNIGRLSKLKLLYLRNNNLKNLPSNIIKTLTNITNVSLSKNPLSLETLLKIDALKNSKIFDLDQEQKEQLNQTLASNQKKTDGEVDLNQFSKTQNSKMSAKKTPEAKKNENSTRRIKQKEAWRIMP